MCRLAESVRTSIFCLKLRGVNVFERKKRKKTFEQGLTDVLFLQLLFFSHYQSHSAVFSCHTLLLLLLVKTSFSSDDLFLFWSPLISSFLPLYSFSVIFSSLHMCSHLDLYLLITSILVSFLFLSYLSFFFSLIVISHFVSSGIFLSHLFCTHLLPSFLRCLS